MIRRPLRLLPSLAASTAALLLVAACGVDEEPSKGSDKKAEADNDTGLSPSPPAAAAADAARPEISLPSDLKYTFEWPRTGNAAKDAVLNDGQQFIKAVDMAIAEQDPLHQAYRFYSESEAAAGSQKFIQEFVDYKDRITGTKRFYDAKVQVNDDETASLIYCEDQNKAFNKSLRTGKTAVTEKSDDDYVLYSSKLRLNDQGVWVTERLTSQRGSAVCRP